MKRVLLATVFLYCFTGCNVKENSDKDINSPIVEDIKQEVIEEIEEEYEDDNPIKVGLYIYTNGRRILSENYESAWPIYTDINGFTAYFANDKEISNSRLQSVWKSLYQNYENIDDYKIGYHLKFDTLDGPVSKTILKPSDGKDFYDYIQIYLYDDIHQDSAWYSHMNDSDVRENTIFTTIKLTTSTKIAEVTSDIELTVFTYNDMDDFDESGNYRGVSSHTTIIKKK